MNTDKKIVLVWPPSLGGSWVSHTIHKMQDDNNTAFDQDSYHMRIFDSAPREKGLSCAHYYNATHKLEVQSIHKNNILKVLSTPYPFNHYINKAHKIVLNAEILDYNVCDKTLIEQFHELTDHAWYILDDEFYKETYYQNYDVDYQLIFTNPVEFFDTIFEWYADHNIPIKKDYSIIDTMVNQYKQTLLNPTEIYANYQNLIWLAWCHAICLRDSIVIDINIDNSCTLSQISDIFKLRSEYFEQQTKDLIFYWD